MISIVRRILRVFERHRIWDAGVELIGSWCFHLYQQHLGVKPYPLRTQDIDFLLPLPFPKTTTVDLADELEALGFQYDFRPDGSMYFWNADLKIEFMVPERGRPMSKGAVVKPLGITAIPLRFVDLLLRHPMTVNADGVNVQLPNPAAFCLHKLLIADRRKHPESRIKDLEQALHVVPILRPATVKSIYHELPRSWRQEILRNLERAHRDIPLLEHEQVALQKMLQSLGKESF